MCWESTPSRKSRTTGSTWGSEPTPVHDAVFHPPHRPQSSAEMPPKCSRCYPMSTKRSWEWTWEQVESPTGGNVKLPRPAKLGGESTA